TLATDSHAVLPVAIERRDRALAGVQRVGTLAEAWPAPRLPDLAADRTEHARDRLAAEPRIRTLDLLRGAARSREDHDLLRRLRRAPTAGGADHQRGGQQIVVAAIGARSDQRLVESQTLARDVLGGERVARAERLGDHRHHVGEIELFV